ncbi:MULTISPECIES: efflux transporter outer membrane subunit [unclassified Sphingomonas]|uniref:efflux transporter outer membrane subunit n=1 Tax=unclassified Sphingomonas TaxID=196159 RepID=UPI0006FC882D|nr:MULTISPECIES: efflux transporter outer membrane subunit [unclassified Sphingomonas]KQM61831.1 transporter [Sphingomonas sp. Leaf16]KQN13104.1 transporter [Sphingomonas sp. Leaf29]KQN19991.1 transporter [Sphingomonas sp. Leaf32]
MKRLTIPLAAMLLAGCSMTPAYERPTAVVPPSWPVGDAYLRQREASLPALTFEQVFTAPGLRTLVGQALVNNRDLRIAAANIRAARAQYRIQRADLFPQVDASARYSYRGTGDGATTSTTSTTGTGGTGGTTVTSRSSNSSFSADLGATAFELDLFGRIRSLTEAEQNRYFATEAGARATRLTLVGDIAEAWATYGADRSLMAVAQATAASARRSVTLTRARLQGGIAPRTDLRQAEQILATAESDLAEQRTQLAQDINALQLLVGAPVDPALLPASIDVALPTIADLPAGIDSSILLRRPDVVQAEYELLAANADIGAARAALFPRLSLTGLVGFASDALRTLFTGGAFNYSVAPSLSYPIFRAGAARAGVEFSKAQRDALLATYERTIQSAFRDVADALARQGTIVEQTRAERANLVAAQDTFRLTEARYRGGIDTFLTSLDAQRSYYSAQRRVVATQLVAATNRVTLYRSLGGDSLLDAGPNGPVPVTPPSPEPVRAE